MPTSKEELPSTIRRSAAKVQRTYVKALDSAHREYHDEERAHRVAYAAVKHVAEKQGDRWKLKSAKGPSDPQAAKRSPIAQRRPARTYGGINANKPKRDLYEDARRAGIRGRSRMSKRQLAEALQRHSARSTARARAR